MGRVTKMNQNAIKTDVIHGPTGRVKTFIVEMDGVRHEFATYGAAKVFIDEAIDGTSQK